MSLQCQILLPPKEGVYRGGHSVTGTLKYSLDEPITFNSINIQLCGKGECYWTESNSDNSSISYSGKEEYVTEKINILDKQGIVEAGVYEHKFAFVLPKKIPSSFHDTVCTIAYKVVAEFHIPGLFNNKVFDTEIPVYGYLERLHPEPLIFGLTKTPFSLTSNKPVNLKVEIDKTFLIPGDKIKLTCTTMNDSNVPVTGIITKLVNQTTYITDHGYKRVRRGSVDESVWEWGGAEKNSKGKVTCDVPTLPNLYTIQNSKILKREYMVNVTAKLPFPHINAVVEIPVVIGEGSHEFEVDMKCEEIEK